MYGSIINTTAAGPSVFHMNTNTLPTIICTFGHIIKTEKYNVRCGLEDLPFKYRYKVVCYLSSFVCLNMLSNLTALLFLSLCFFF